LASRDAASYLAARDERASEVTMENGGRGEGTSQLKRDAEDMAADMQARIEGLRGYAEDAGDFIRAFARERPVAAVAIAAGVGFILGRMLSRT
jgi:ElaB/YqjD/DUF883 family membrane-anchored ribosome-binding protein